MKHCACLLLAGLCLLGQQPPAATCFVSGRVVNAANGEPVSRARLLLGGTDNPTGGSDSAAVYTTVTDDRGRFAMKDIEAGKYNFTAQRAGFVRMSYGARRPGREGITLSLDTGQQLTGVIFRMTAHAVIAGRILDEDGEPLQGVQVTADRYWFIEGKRQLSPAGFASTDDLGEYRMFGLSPGRYYLMASNTDQRMSMQRVRKSPKAVEEGYVPTYYPGATDIGNATLVEVAAGTQMRGMDFTLSKARTVSLRGHVIAPAGVNRQRAMIMVSPRGERFWNLTRRARALDPQGAFDIAEIGPGAYSVTAFLQDGKTSYSARQQVDVGASNIEDLILNLSEGAELSGQLRFEGRTPPGMAGISIALESPAEFGFRFGAAPYAQVKDDGTFVVSHLASEVYQVRLSWLPDGYYLKSVRIGDDELKEVGIDATREIGGPLLLTVSSNAGQIEGLVTNAKEQPVPGVTVVLVPEPKKRERFDMFQHLSTDQYGRYTFKTIEPGEYKLFAWEDVERGEYTDPEFLTPVENRGVAIGIQEGSREHADLKLIPAKPPDKPVQRAQPKTR